MVMNATLNFDAEAIKTIVKKHLEDRGITVGEMTFHLKTDFDVQTGQLSSQRVFDKLSVEADLGEVAANASLTYDGKPPNCS